MSELSDAAKLLRSLHVPGRPLFLVNAWDVASADRVVAAGGQAVGTSSAAVAAALGLPDGPDTPLDPLFEVVRRIARAVPVPVTADLLDGYGRDATELVDRLLAAGAVGCNLEDSDHRTPGTLADPGLVADRLAAVRAAATAAGVDLVLNARIDAYLHHGPAATPEVIRRARLYLAAGADCVYPLRLTDPEVIRQLATDLATPVNANLAPPFDGRSAAAAAGAARISLGPSGFHRAMSTFTDLATGLLGTP
ncbi:isocitrate lyase/PEP mutase family protein [Nocardia blacklockiae]|uniref:isocitrate lyase/PEP mutase family protein n=1 Tax=Nocardia blacklockiae TaxID=480036 RepID=UPI0018952EFB|nr:isocitrate lyase/phosphoenolpyruvate mutase family protein [Nocardia blacklockiae]MBF6169843.1 isocitrate lyase/phosphoenolpyruvate mutase family protein [Nocardia blacklockiae]